MKILRLASRFLSPTAIGTIVGVVSCAPLLGLEEATCDPTQDSTCEAINSVPLANNAGTNMGQAGSGAMVGNNAGAGMGGAGLGGAGMGGAGMGGAGLGGAGMGGAGMGDGDSPECTEYCSRIQAVCTAGSGFQQYATPTVCLTYCKLFELGNPATPTGANTLACRMDEVLSAEITGEVAVHCPSGGPGGNGTCGSNCEGYCTAMTVTCGEGIATYERFADTQDCLDLCAVVPDLEEDYSVAIQEEDSVQCRLYHVTAATARAAAHCAHASGEEFCLPGG